MEGLEDFQRGKAATFMAGVTQVSSQMQPLACLDAEIAASRLKGLTGITHAMLANISCQLFSQATMDTITRLQADIRAADGVHEEVQPGGMFSAG